MAAMKCFICGNHANSRIKSGEWICKDHIEQLGGMKKWFEIRKMSPDEIRSRTGGLQAMLDNSPAAPAGGLVCPNCSSNNIRVDNVQENLGSTSVSKTKSLYKEKKHGCLWWLFIGSWWWIIDAFLWIFMFIPRALMHIGRKKKYVGTSTTVSSTVNHIVYRKVCTCQNCGHSWELK